MRWRLQLAQDRVSAWGDEVASGRRCETPLLRAAIAAETRLAQDFERELADAEAPRGEVWAAGGLRPGDAGQAVKAEPYLSVPEP